MSTGAFVGRFQPLHDGHKACIRKVLEQHDHCVVLVRDTDQTDKNPFPYEERKKMILEAFPDGNVSVVSISDPDANLTFYIGRDVGYGLIQLDAQTEAISATDIRKQLYDKKN